MGRKKRKAEESDVPTSEVPDDPVTKQIKQEVVVLESVEPPQLSADSSAIASAVVVEDKRDDTTTPATVSNSFYGLHAHSGDMVEEDLYVSDGSDDEEQQAEIVLAGSRMGVMRRGLHHPLLVQPTRQWKRDEAHLPDKDAAAAAEEQESLDLAQLDPVQRAARLLQEKQRKLQEAKETARRMESEENAGRDPCLFSKRTAFDIRMDQIEDKPWTRGDITDFFNYTLTEEDWMDYSTQQLAIRQELADASRQRRPPDPTIVPVTARTPAKQTPKVAILGESAEDGGDTEMGEEDGPVIGPTVPQGGIIEEDVSFKAEELEQATDIQHLGSGGAWGAGAAPGSLLARLIEEQESGGTSPVASVAEPTRSYEEEPYNEPEQHYGRGHDERSGYDNFGSGYDRYGGQPPQLQPQQGYYGNNRGGYGGHGDGADFDDRAYGAPPPPWAGRGGRGGPPPWAGRGGRGRGRGGFGGRGGHDDHYNGGGWR